MGDLQFEGVVSDEVLLDTFGISNGKFIEAFDYSKLERPSVSDLINRFGGVPLVGSE